MGLLVYIVLADTQGIPEDARCPASSLTVAMFIVVCPGPYAGSTLANYICGVRAWHIIHRATWTMDLHVQAALVGAAKLAPPKSKKAPKH